MKLLLILLLLIFSCQKEEEGIREYLEISAKPNKELADLKTALFSWKTPENWKEIQGNDMRLASFVPLQNESEFLLSLLQLPSSGGGIEANLKRWLGQIKVELSETELRKFVEQAPVIQTSTNLEAVILDLSLLPQSPTESMNTAIIAAPKATLFIKMSGTQSNLKKHKKDFFDFVKGISRRDTNAS
jgi:hypothetical protein